MSHLYHGYVSHNQMVDCLILELEARSVGVFQISLQPWMGVAFPNWKLFTAALVMIFLGLKSGKLQEPVSEISHLIDDIDEFHWISRLKNLHLVRRFYPLRMTSEGTDLWQLMVDDQMGSWWLNNLWGLRRRDAWHVFWWKIVGKRQKEETKGQTEEETHFNRGW